MTDQWSRPLTSEPSSLGSFIQALLLMNPKRAFILRKEGDEVIVETIKK